MTFYTASQRQQISEQAIGKTVASLAYEPDGDYWVMTFKEGPEMAFRFMAEIEREWKP